MLVVVFSALAFVFGLIVGSFLNVVIYRHHGGVRGSFFGSSACLSCNARLTPRELIPIVSFFLQGGRCRTCGSSISWQYPVVEIATGLVFTLVFYGFAPPLFSSGAPFFPGMLFVVYFWALAAAFIALFVYDIRHKILPDTFISVSAAFTLLHLLALFFLGVVTMYAVFLHIVAGVLLAAPFAALWFISRGRWIGLGDAKLLFVIGLALGLSSGAAALLLGIWAGAIAGLLLLVMSRLKILRGAHITRKTEIPLGPFLIIGFFIVLFTGWDIWSILALFT